MAIDIILIITEKGSFSKKNKLDNLIRFNINKIKDENLDT